MTDALTGTDRAEAGTEAVEIRTTMPELPADAMGEQVFTVEELARQFNVSSSKFKVAKRSQPETPNPKLETELENLRNEAMAGAQFEVSGFRFKVLEITKRSQPARPPVDFYTLPRRNRSGLV